MSCRWNVPTEEGAPDRKLFETIPGISAPWHVAGGELKTGEKRVELWPAPDATR